MSALRRRFQRFQGPVRGCLWRGHRRGSVSEARRDSRPVAALDNGYQTKGLEVVDGLRDKRGSREGHGTALAAVCRLEGLWHTRRQCEGSNVNEHVGGLRDGQEGHACSKHLDLGSGRQPCKEGSHTANFREPVHLVLGGNGVRLGPVLQAGCILRGGGALSALQLRMGRSVHCLERGCSGGGEIERKASLKPYLFHSSKQCFQRCATLATFDWFLRYSGYTWSVLLGLIYQLVNKLALWLPVRLCKLTTNEHNSSTSDHDHCHDCGDRDCQCFHHHRECSTHSRSHHSATSVDPVSCSQTHAASHGPLSARTAPCANQRVSTAGQRSLDHADIHYCRCGCRCSAGGNACSLPLQTQNKSLATLQEQARQRPKTTATRCSAQARL